MSGTGKRKPGSLDGDEDGLLDALFGDAAPRRPDPAAVLFDDPIASALDDNDPRTYREADDPETTEETPPTTLQVTQRRAPSLDLLKNDAAPVASADPAPVSPRPVAPVAASRPGALPALRTSGLVPPSLPEDDEPIPVSSIEGRGFGAPQPAPGAPRAPHVLAGVAAAPATGWQQPLATARPNVGEQDWQAAPRPAVVGRTPPPADASPWPDDGGRLGYPAPSRPPASYPAPAVGARPPEPERLSQPTWPSDRPQVRSAPSPVPPPVAGPEVRVVAAPRGAAVSAGPAVVPTIVEAPRTGRSQRATAPIDDFEDAPLPKSHLVPEERVAPPAPSAAARPPAAPAGTPLWWWAVGGLLVLLVGYWVYGMAQADLARVSP